MPKLLSFLPCLKAVIGDDSMLTVVSVLETISIPVSEDEPIPENAGSQMPWQMASIWYSEKKEFGLDLEQTVELIMPNGVSLGIMAYRIDLTNRIEKYKFDGALFPIGLPGEVNIRVGFKRLDSEDIDLQMEYPIMVKHVNIPSTRPLEQVASTSPSKPRKKRG